MRAVGDAHLSYCFPSPLPIPQHTTRLDPPLALDRSAGAVWHLNSAVRGQAAQFSRPAGSSFRHNALWAGRREIRGAAALEQPNPEAYASLRAVELSFAAGGEGSRVLVAMKV